MAEQKSAAEGPYKIVAEPIPGATNTDDTNRGGIVIHLWDTRNGTRLSEVARVGYARAHAKNKKVSFEDQLEVVLGKARAAIKILNEQFDSSGGLL